MTLTFKIHVLSHLVVDLLFTLLNYIIKLYLHIIICMLILKTIITVWIYAKLVHLVLL